MSRANRPNLDEPGHRPRTRSDRRVADVAERRARVHHCEEKKERVEVYSMTNRGGKKRKNVCQFNNKSEIGHKCYTVHCDVYRRSLLLQNTNNVHCCTRGVRLVQHVGTTRAPETRMARTTEDCRRCECASCRYFVAFRTCNSGLCTRCSGTGERKTSGVTSDPLEITGGGAAL